MAPRKRVTNDSRQTRPVRSAHANPPAHGRGYAAASAKQKSGLRPAVILIAILVVLILVAIGVVRGCVMGSSRPLLPAGEELTVVIEEGASANSIGELL